MRRTSTLLALVFGAFFWASSAGADEDLAKKSYAEGVAAFEKGEYAKAADAFRSAYRLKPTWKVLYNVGQSEAAAKRYGLALEAFEAYLAQGGDDVPDSRREEVLGEVERLRKMVGTVEIEAPEGAAIFVDGVERGTAPLPGKLAVSAGVEHRAWAVAGGEKTKERAFKVMGADSIAISLAFDPTEKGPTRQPVDAVTEPSDEPGDAEPVVAETSDGDGKSGLRTGGWVMVGVGGAMVVAGVITGVMAYKKDEKLYDECPGEHCLDTAEYRDDIDSLNALSLVTDVMLFAGGAIAATGAVLLIVDRVKGEERPVEVAPVVGPGFSGAMVTGRF